MSRCGKEEFRLPLSRFYDDMPYVIIDILSSD